MQTTLIVAIVSALAGILGVMLGQVLGAARAHTDWVNDHKRLEYRQLLDQLYDTVSIVSENRPTAGAASAFKGSGTSPSEAISEAIMKLARVFEDRLFIGDGLKTSGAKEDWYELKKLIYYDPELRDVTPKELWYSRNKLHQHEDRLRQKILDLARKDIVKFKFFGIIEE